MGFLDGFERDGVVHAGIGENDIDPAVVTLDARVERRQVGEVRHVALYADRAVTDLADRVIERSPSTPGDVHQCPFLSELLCGCQPDAVATAGNHDDLVFEPLRHHTVFRVSGGMLHFKYGGILHLASRG